MIQIGQNFKTEHPNQQLNQKFIYWTFLSEFIYFVERERKTCSQLEEEEEEKKFKDQTVSDRDIWNQSSTVRKEYIEPGSNLEPN